MKSLWPALLLLLAGCASPPPDRAEPEGLITPPALQGLAGELTKLAATTSPSVVRIENKARTFKPIGRYLKGLAMGFLDLLNPHPYWEWPYRIISFPFYLAFGYFDLSSALGSGFFVDEIHIVTAAHVVENSDTIHCHLTDGRRATAVIEAIDPALDLALLRLEGLRGPPPKPLRLRNYPTRPGEPVLAVGFPSRELDQGGLFGTGADLPPNPRITVGIVSAVQVELGNPKTAYVELDAALNPGNSGGPVVALDGTVVGVAGMVGVGKENEGYAVPVGTVLAAFANILKPKSEGAVTPPAKEEAGESQ